MSDGPGDAIPAPISPVVLQANYAAERAAWREEYLVWLAERELPGSPFTPIWSALP